MNLLEEIDDFIKLKGITHFILRFWLILLKFFSFSRADGMLASLPDSRIIVCVENSPSCRHENADDDGSTVKRRHYYWSAGGITLRLSFISRRSLAFAASRALLPTSVRREASPMGWLRSACSLLWHQSRTTLCWKIDFIHVLPFSLCLFLSLSFSISLSLLLFLSVFLSSLGTTLAKQVLLSLPLGVNYLDKDLFRRNTLQERRNTWFCSLLNFPHSIKMAYSWHSSWNLVLEINGIFWFYERYSIIFGSHW